MEKEKNGDRAPGTGDRPAAARPETNYNLLPVTAPEIAASKGRRRLVMVTATDEPSGRIADRAGVDLVLVGDSLAMAALGRPDTLSVTMDEMIHHTRAVAAGVRRALLVADMPFGSYQASVADAVRNACRLVAEGGARAVKLEGAREAETEAISRAGIPVVSHLGLTPQSVNRFGGYRVQAREVDDAVTLVAQAEALAAAGAFLLVLEAIPSPVAAVVTRRLAIPTVGIGAGADCDGQVLVWADILGLSEGPLPRFVRQYADIARIAGDAVRAFAADVRARRYPAPAESYPTPAGLEDALAERWGRE
jgi:3-methyl-2-oxobutanoate hydroxymethyltransferase